MDRKEKKKQKRELVEYTTKYGEAVSSNFHWITPEKQKDRAKELEDMGKTKGQKKSNN